jgi:hypothetical protein
VIFCSDHGQSPVREIASPGHDLAASGALVTASNRAAMVYRLQGCRLDPRELASVFDADPAVEVALFREGREAVARREGEEVRFAPTADGWRLGGDGSILDHPDALRRAWAALANPNAGEVLLSAAPGHEFADLAGAHHAGGGSHGALSAGDSIVPMVTVGVGGQPRSITEIAPLILSHFGVALPGYYARAA